MKWISLFPNEAELIANWDDVFSCFSSPNLTTVYWFEVFPGQARIWIFFLQMQLAPLCQCRNASNSEIFSVYIYEFEVNLTIIFLVLRLVQQLISSVIFPYQPFTSTGISPFSFDKRWKTFITRVFVSLEVHQT